MGVKGNEGENILSLEHGIDAYDPATADQVVQVKSTLNINLSVKAAIERLNNVQVRVPGRRDHTDKSITLNCINGL